MLYASGLHFSEQIKIVEKYWESRPSSIYITCCGISPKQIEKRGKRQPRYIICASLHKIDEHYYRVNGCNKGTKKICAYVVVKCANCGGSYPANSNRCMSRQKAEIDVRKQKSFQKTAGKEKARAKPVRKRENANQGKNRDQDEKDLNLDTNMDLAIKVWAMSQEKKMSS